MQTTRKNWRAAQKARTATTGTLYRSLQLRAKRMTPKDPDYAEISRAMHAETKRTEAQLADDAEMSERYTALNESRRVLAEQLALAPDYRPAVEAMRARIAKECGELQPYTHKQGWTL